jgi:hypothetical protein
MHNSDTDSVIDLFIILYYIILYYITLHYIILYYIILYYISYIIYFSLIFKFGQCLEAI